MRNYIQIVENDGFRFLYHVSPKANLKSIMTNGLDPQFSRGSKAIYLASDPSHAAGYDDHHGQNGKSVMLCIDVNMLDLSLLHPDDVDLPDMLNDPDGELDLDDEGADGPWWEYSWQDSLQLCGQCRYEGIIPPAAMRVENA